jgi:hydrogenase-4 component H
VKKKNKRFGLLSFIFDAFIKDPETVEYPFGPLELPENFRGAIEFLAENCTGCGLCARYCPANALHLDKKSREDYQLGYFPARCAYCGSCEDNCRYGAIFHSKNLVEPTKKPADSVVLRHFDNKKKRYRS